ncbi:MAG TPA: DNA-binding response regulator [Lachnospiraceae bacterium]|nr:DNA-binding response regulator [Lachnospiraceae bacterium]
MRVLVVEDEKRLAETLADIISESGDTVDISNDGEEGFFNAVSGIYDAIVLDVMLPGMNGFDILRKIRDEGISTPVLMLTARTELGDRVNGLNLGADYYLTKPFENEELIASLHAIMRRKADFVPDDIKFGDLTIHPSTCTISCKGKDIKLSVKEFELLRYLMISGKNIISKETIINKIWGYDSDAGDNNVEAYISFLRRKLTVLKSSVSIKAVRKVGYHLEEE